MQKWEVVRQDSDWFTIFKGQEQYCDIFGNPMCYGCYWEAKEVCDELNNQENKRKRNEQENMAHK